MLDEDLARIRAHRNNIHRYRRLLGRGCRTSNANLLRETPRRGADNAEGAGRQNVPGRIYPPKGSGRLHRALGAAVVLRLLGATADDQDRRGVRMIRGRNLNVTVRIAGRACACAQSGRTGDDPRPCRFRIPILCHRLGTNSGSGRISLCGE